MSQDVGASVNTGTSTSDVSNRRNPPELVICPYVWRHQVKRENWARHLNKCQAYLLKTPTSSFHDRVKHIAICPYNSYHIMMTQNHLCHILECPDNPVRRETGAPPSNITRPTYVDKHITEGIRLFVEGALSDDLWQKRYRNVQSSFSE